MLTANFDAQVLSGHVDVISASQVESASTLLLDVKDITVEKVQDVSGKDLLWEVCVSLLYSSLQF